jgi:mono/diheme cytochrome c family protein
MKNHILILLAVLILAVLACSLVGNNVNRPDTSTGLTETSTGADAPPAELQKAFDGLPSGDATRGEQIFTDTQSCHTCHLDQSVGPQFPGEPPLAALAETRRPSYPAEVYLYESIVNPGAYVVQGFHDDIMPQDYEKMLTKQDLADLVAYLLTMK